MTGYNKVGADFRVTENDNELSVSVTQMDTLIIKASFVLSDPFSPSEQSKNGQVINLKYIPSVVRNAPPDVKQLTVSPVQNIGEGQMRTGTATLEFYSSRFNPLNQIPILNIEKVGCAKGSFSLTFGKVLYDYLKQGEVKKD